MDRFFVFENDIDEAEGKCSITNSEDVKHIAKVLRLKEGDEVEVCNGKNREFLCEIESVSKSSVDLAIKREIDVNRESPVSVTIYQGLPKAQKFELIVQKLTEVGVSRIVPVITERTVVKLSSQKEEKKSGRWEKIIHSAAKQSKRGVLPVLEGAMNLKDAMEDIKGNELNIVPYENESAVGIKQTLREKGSEAKSVGIFIGPEGGFEEEEIHVLSENGVVPVTLGKRILRTETASIVSAAIVLYELSDLG
ncbi:16S rRNA (uracil1498-N3)-methyltransferase [Peptoclostridium litorale DSM 5388]|uniref:Ribosomal RNA small subunit methyltransferase E n=1 Tax=Peptoclostridium litorale DSM 5388 TaxID=1121324 RepID=A0A069RDE4_PEPLI|nr:16S rRNA (uracil(1498)-N(3))-methyltransferase [Peptoclostridium litorale]KDR95061.1 ribosomal RNA small subunit methyltransferase E [Peptoclostridium litorale DSM 5388]SIN75651.1 16S rRNA (uracil1498-N3)-methyltransferase [Peptoclostridium litorale DSM 5388]